MIRTNSVTLTTLPIAIAYRRKAPSGGAALVIVRSDASQPGIATISKTSGKPIVAANTPAELYPEEAFEEALALTAGMPYHKQGRPSAPAQQESVDTEPPVQADEEEVVAEEVEVVIDSDEYQKLLAAYTNKNGKLSYDLMNKEMIQFAHRSDLVARMVAAGESEDAILTYVVGTKFRNATGNKELTDEQVAAMAELIDEVSPRGAFKELRRSIRAMLGKAKTS
jgi:hypothetical protein